MDDSFDRIRDLYETGDLPAALALMKRYLVRRPDDGRAWELAGLIQFAAGEYSQSVAAIERACIHIPLRPAARVCLGHGYGKIGRRNLSRDLLAGLIRDDALSVPLLLQVASGLDAIDHPTVALQACRRAAERDPQNPQPYYDMGYYAARCGYEPRYTESLARRAISLDPENVCFRVGLAAHLFKLERVQDAYDVVRELSNEQIEAITCSCCLNRIVSVYEAAGDYRRVVLCRQQLLQIEIQGHDPDCV